jgi:hypothetical protein
MRKKRDSLSVPVNINGVFQYPVQAEEFEALCYKCNYHFNWKSEFTTRPPCPRCGAIPEVFYREEREYRKRHKNRWLSEGVK